MFRMPKERLLFALGAVLPHHRQYACHRCSRRALAPRSSTPPGPSPAGGPPPILASGVASQGSHSSGQPRESSLQNGTLRGAEVPESRIDVDNTSFNGIPSPPEPAISSSEADMGNAGGETYLDGLSYPPHELDWCTTSSNAFELVKKGTDGTETCIMDVCSDTAMFRQRVDEGFVDTFRMSSPYINAHSGRVFVIHLPGALTEESLFGSVMEDVALMRTVGIKVVLVLGPYMQIERRFERAGKKPVLKNGVRVTDEFTLDIVKEAAGSMLFEVESKLSRGVVGSPGLSRISMVSGSFYTAQPVGVIDGDDFGYTGKVRRVDAESIVRRLDGGDIVIVPNLGYSPTGQLFNCQSEEVAGEIAQAVSAEKLIFMANGESIYSKRKKRPTPNLTLTSAQRFLELNQESLPLHFRRALQISVKALNKGVTRAHLLNRLIDGVLLMEVFHRDGVGLMISRDLYEGIRCARPKDVAGIENIIKPLEERGVLVKRGRAMIEKGIGNYIVVERDGMIIACLSLCAMADNDTWAELGCLAVHPDYRKQGKGDALLGYTERLAYGRGVRHLFILSTVTFQWFLERGFSEVAIDKLPESRRARYDHERNSKVYLKVLEGGRAVDEAEVIRHLC